MRLFLFGATGSIGKATLSVASDLGIEVVGVGARKNWRKILEICSETNADIVHIADPTAAEILRKKQPRLHIFTGSPEEAIISSHADVVVNGVAGAAGLKYSLATINAKIPLLALANKESLVMAGEFLLERAKETDTKILPIDSEHSSLLLLISRFAPENISEVYITATGGPLLRKRNFENVTPEEALSHPVWSMGSRISVDSATMLNKVFEVVEAHILFGLPYERIKVVIHPEGFVHAGVRLCDGTLILHTTTPDMRFAIQQALCYPNIGSKNYGGFDLEQTLNFEAPDVRKFKALEAIEDLRSGAGIAYRVALNAADEVAVSAFLNRRIPFTAITTISLNLARLLKDRAITSLQDVLNLDSYARTLAENEVKKWKQC